MASVFELCPGRKIGGEHPCFIIAEIGQNHQGDIETAKKMIQVAKVINPLTLTGGVSLLFGVLFVHISVEDIKAGSLWRVFIIQGLLCTCVRSV